MNFGELVERALAVLRQRHRVSYRALQLEFGLDDERLAVLREELIDVLGAARDLNGKILVWAGAGAAPRPVAADAADRGLVEPEAERRQLTLLFCDLVASTQLSGRVDPEDWRDVIGAYRARCEEIMARHGGFVAQWVGDGVDVYFGYPAAQENDAQRAVEAGREVLQAVATIGTGFSAAHGLQLAARVGLHSGPVVVGHLEADRSRVVAIGETANVCGRIQALTVPGSIAISEATCRLLGNAFAVVDLGEHELKGLPRPVRVFRVGEPLSAPRRMAGSVVLPLVDRAGERHAIGAAFAGAAAGRGNALLLSGEPGIGKSRLVQHARQLALDASWQIIDCRCSPYHQSSALHPLREGLREGFPAGDAAALTALADECAHLGNAAPEVVPFLAQWLGLPVPPGFSFGNITPQRQRARTLELIAALLVQRAAQAPVLLIVEDLHWVDPSTTEGLERVLDHAAGARIVSLLTRRPAPAGPLDSRADIVRLSVERLPSADCGELVRAAAGRFELTVEVVERLAARGEGVPLFLEEMTKTVVESPALVAGGTGAADIEAEIPSTLYGCLMARIDRLKGVRIVAQIAACIGRHFDYALLREIAGLDEALLRRCLQQLVDAELVFREGADPASHYTFKHSLMQDAAAQALLKSSARQYHARIAAALMEKFPAVAELQPEVVAHHFTAAGAFPEAIAHRQRAGLMALQRFANAEAIAHFRQALELVRRLPAGPESAAQEMALQTLVAVPLTLTRGWASPDVETAYRRAHELSALAGESPQLFPSMVGLFSYHLVSDQMFLAAETAARNFAFAERIGDPELILEAEQDRASVAVYTGRFEAALTSVRRMATIYVPERHHAHVHFYGKDPMASALAQGSLALACLGQLDAALAQSRRAVALMEQWPHPFSLVWTQLGLAISYQMRGEYAPMRSTCETALAMSREHGFPNWLAQLLVYFGWTRVVAGEIEAGIAQVREGIGIWAMTGAKLMTNFLNYFLADGLRRAGRLEESLATVATTTSLARDSGDVWCLPALECLRGEILLAAGDRAAGEVALAEALGLALASRAELFALRAAVGLARLRVAAGSPGEACALLGPRLAARTEGLDLADLREARELFASSGGTPSSP